MSTPTATETLTFPPTAAARYLAEHEAEMAAAVEAEKVRLADAASGLSKPTLLGSFPEKSPVKAPKGNASKGEIAAAWVDAHLSASDQVKAQRDATYAVNCETAADDHTADIIAQADALKDAAIAAAQGGIGLSGIAEHIKWNGLDIMSTEVASRMARDWQAARSRGVEPRDLAREMARRAIEMAMEPSRSASNIRPDGHGISVIASGLGARSFLRAISRVLDGDLAYLY